MTNKIRSNDINKVDDLVTWVVYACLNGPFQRYNFIFYFLCRYPWINDARPVIPKTSAYLERNIRYLFIWRH